MARGEGVRVLDDFSSGLRENLEEVRGDIELVEGDVRHLDTCRRACEGVEIVLHKADAAAARRLLGYEPEVSFEAGLRQTIDWYRWALETGYGGWAEKTG